MCRMQAKILLARKMELAPPCSFPFLLSPKFSRDQNLRSHATDSTSLARELLLRRLLLWLGVCYSVLGVREHSCDLNSAFSLDPFLSSIIDFTIHDKKVHYLNFEIIPPARHLHPKTKLQTKICLRQCIESQLHKMHLLQP